jgi:hypothetical protein
MLRGYLVATEPGDVILLDERVLEGSSSYLATRIPVAAAPAVIVRVVTPGPRPDATHDSTQSSLLRAQVLPLVG